MNLFYLSPTIEAAKWLVVIWSVLIENYSQSGLRQVQISSVLNRISEDVIPVEAHSALLSLLVTRQYLVFSGGGWYWFFAEKDPITIEIAAEWLKVSQIHSPAST